MEAMRYICIDLKSFYASVECVERGLDPLTARLVVADESRTDKTICLAVSPALKAYGISGRARLFEVKQRLREVQAATGREVDFLIARPQMARYMEVSAAVYDTYLRYIAPEDIHVYSIDEVFIDAGRYLSAYGLTAHALAMRMIRDVLKRVGITATAGIGTNLYLAKIAMDIQAKRMKPDRDGVRIAELDEAAYRRLLWDHLPLTDFWQVGRGTCRRLDRLGVRTMGDLARASLRDEAGLYRMFGINAELLIDHAWGIEPCTMADIKAYRPSSLSLSSGQVLSTPYPFVKARVIVQEMTERLMLDLVAGGQTAEAIVLYVGYDRENVDAGGYTGPIRTDYYGRRVPEPVRGTADLGAPTASAVRAIAAVLRLFDRLVDRRLTVRRLNLAAIRVAEESGLQQLDLFTDAAAERREKIVQRTMLQVQDKYGKSALLRGYNLLEGATGMERARQIGGHRA